MGIEEMLLEMVEKSGIEKGIEKGREIGREEEREKIKYKFVSNLLADSIFDDEKIASLASVSVQFVQKVRAELGL